MTGVFSALTMMIIYGAKHTSTDDALKRLAEEIHGIKID